MLKSNGGQISDKDCFLFSLPAQKLRLDAVSIWQKFPSNRKECKCPHLTTVQSLAQHLIKPSLLWKSVYQANLMCWLFSNYIGDQYYSSKVLIAFNGHCNVVESYQHFWTVWKLVTKSWLMNCETCEEVPIWGVAAPIFHILTQNANKMPH